MYASRRTVRWCIDRGCAATTSVFWLPSIKRISSCVLRLCPRQLHYTLLHKHPSHPIRGVLTLSSQSEDHALQIFRLRILAPHRLPRTSSSMNALSTYEWPSNPSKLRLEDVAPHRKPAHLCDKCLMVFEDHHFTTRLTNERPPFHHKSLAALQRSAKRGCSLCSRFLESGPREQVCFLDCKGKGHTEEEHIEPGTITFHELTYVRLHVREGDLQASYEAASDAGKLFEFLY
jgi:hypothetical protein